MVKNTQSALLQLFDRYDPIIDYDLTTADEFKRLSPELQPMYTVHDRAKLDAMTVQSSNEPFVTVPLAAQYHKVMIECHVGATPYGSVGDTLYLRATAAEKLCQAAHHLQELVGDQYRLLLTDAYRPLALQRQHFEHIKSILAQQGYTEAELYKHTVQLIADPAVLPPHTTGGTVDITLFDISQQKQVWLGTSVDAIDTKLIHTWHRDVAPAERKLRVLLYQVMTAAGFINHPLEWWHYSYGDTEWALHTGQLATLYNAVEQLPQLD